MDELRKGCTKNTLILGDFNLPDINWELNEGFQNDSKKFVECFNDCFLNQIINEPTRNRAILDLAFVTDISIVRDVVVGEDLGGSDHKLIRIKLGLTKEKICNNVMVPDIQKGDFMKFRSLLREINWEYEFEEKNASEMWSIFREIIE